MHMHTYRLISLIPFSIILIPTDYFISFKSWRWFIRVIPLFRYQPHPSKSVCVCAYLYMCMYVKNIFFPCMCIHTHVCIALLLQVQHHLYM